MVEISEEEFMRYLQMRGYKQSTISRLIPYFKRVKEGCTEDDFVGAGKYHVRQVLRHIQTYLRYYKKEVV